MSSTDGIVDGGGGNEATSNRRLPDHATTSFHATGGALPAVDVAGDVTAVLFDLLGTTKFAYAGGDKRKQTNLILSVGRAPSQSKLEGIYATEVRAGHAKNTKVTRDFIYNSRRALLGFLDKAPGAHMCARLFLTMQWQRPHPTSTPLPTDHTSNASEICAECAS
jgi:hypothetical protein